MAAAEFWLPHSSNPASGDNSGYPMPGKEELEKKASPKGKEKGDGWISWPAWTLVSLVQHEIKATLVKPVNSTPAKPINPTLLKPPLEFRALPAFWKLNYPWAERAGAKLQAGDAG